MQRGRFWQILFLTTFLRILLQRGRFLQILFTNTFYKYCCRGQDFYKFLFTNIVAEGKIFTNTVAEVEDFYKYFYEYFLQILLQRKIFPNTISKYFLQILLQRGRFLQILFTNTFYKYCCRGGDFDKWAIPTGKGKTLFLCFSCFGWERFF